jgi:rubrerythrin
VPSPRFFVCNGCGTVYADVEQPADCHRCEDGLFEELEPGRQAFDYFTGG